MVSRRSTNTQWQSDRSSSFHEHAVTDNFVTFLIYTCLHPSSEVVQNHPAKRRKNVSPSGFRRKNNAPEVERLPEPAFLHYGIHFPMHSVFLAGRSVKMDVFLIISVCLVQNQASRCSASLNSLYDDILHLCSLCGCLIELDVLFNVFVSLNRWQNEQFY